jgi:hypothetical protein
MTELELIEKYGFEGLAKSSFKYFFTRVLHYTWTTWHEDVYNDLASGKKRLLIEIARGHGKTIFFVSYALWLVYRGNPVDILVVSYSEEQIRNNVMNLIESIVMKNDYLAHLRPTKQVLWGAQLKQFSTGAKIRGESFGSSVRGAHPDVLLIDDPLKDKGGMTPGEQHDYFMSALMGTVKRDTVVIVDGTPLDNGDLLEQLENNKAFTFRAYPAENEARTEALFPELFTLDELRQIEMEVGTLAYSRERLLKRIDPATSVFKDKYRVIHTDMDYPQFGVVRTIIDPAISEKDDACDSAIVTVGMTYTNHAYEIDTRLIKANDPKKILDEIVKVATLFHKAYVDYAIVIESELFQKVLAYDLRQIILERGLDIRLIEVTHQGIQGKHERIVGLQPKWEAKAIHLLPESPLISQFRFYRPNIRGFKLDGIDAFSWIRNEQVNVPIVEAREYNPGVPDSAWE